MSGYETLHDFSTTAWKRGMVKEGMRCTMLVGSARVRIACSPVPTAAEGQPYAGFTAVASHGVAPYVYTASGLPFGITINSTTGVVSGIPYLLQSDGQLFGAIVINATDALGRRGASAPFSIFVTPAGTLCGTLGNQTLIAQSGAYLDLLYNVQITTQTTVTITDENGNVITTEYVDDAAPTILSYPTISGTAAPFNTLTATSGVWDTPSLPFTYQWYSNNVAIPGATSISFLLTAAQANTYVKMVVTVNDTYGVQNSVTPTVLVSAASSGYSLDFSQPQNSLYGGIATF
jgi:hypothetical protein